MDREAGRKSAGKQFLWVGNALWLDFVNTQIVQDGQDVDLLNDEADVADWSAQSGVAAFQEDAANADDGMTALQARSGRLSTPAQSLLDAAREFRHILRRLAAGCAASEPVSDDIIDALNARLRRKQGHETLTRHDAGYALAFHESGTDADILFARLAHSAAELLTRGDARLVRKCENPACVLYFYDNSKNHARRWCSMSGCGNRHKQQAHYQRKRGTA